MLLYEAHKVYSQVLNIGDRGMALMSGLSIREGADFFQTWEVLGSEVNHVEITAKMWLNIKCSSQFTCLISDTLLVTLSWRLEIL